MKCYNHEDREAVAACRHCGKALCKECADRYHPCLCEECAELLRVESRRKEHEEQSDRRQKYVDALVDTRSEFLAACIKGVIAAVIMAWLCFQSDQGLAASAIWLGLGFFIPFGWRFLTYLQSFLPVTIFGTIWFWIVWILMKAFLSIFAGVPAFLYQLVRTFQTNRKLRTVQEDAQNDVLPD